MQNIKQWVKDNQDLIALGALVGMATAATIGVVVITRKSVATQNLIASRVPAPGTKYSVPDKFSGHNFAGLVSQGEQGDLWAHIDSDPAMEPFKIGHIDFENKMAYYSEYPHAGPCPEAVSAAELPSGVVDLNNLDSVEAAMVAQETANA